VFDSCKILWFIASWSTEVFRRKLEEIELTIWSRVRCWTVFHTSFISISFRIDGTILVGPRLATTTHTLVGLLLVFWNEAVLAGRKAIFESFCGSWELKGLVEVERVLASGE
jgi:hypothetical protein